MMDEIEPARRDLPPGLARRREVPPRAAGQALKASWPTSHAKMLSGGIGVLQPGHLGRELHPRGGHGDAAEHQPEQLAEAVAEMQAIPDIRAM